MTGIFWITPNRKNIFFATTETLDKSEKYGNWLISKYNHFQKWEELEQLGYLNSLPIDVRSEYFYVPRGRVSYHTTENKFYIFHGNWLTEPLKKLLCKHYQLAVENVVFQNDEHYTI